jgi:ubiquinone/menaquinone biosynthesis C-methylase UbiE
MTEEASNYSVERLMEYGKDYFNYVKEVRGVDLTYYGNWQRDFAKFIIEIAELDPDKKWNNILDVGCATALNLRAMDELGIFSKLYGTDVSYYMINEIIPTLHDFGSYADFFATPSHDLSMIFDNDIDLITCTHVLEHLQNEEKLHETMEELKRVLHPDGKILIIVPTITKEFDPSESIVHVLNEGALWWSKFFSKYFKSESSAARKKFKATKFKPNRNKEESFYDAYNPAWTIYRLVHKK